MLAFLYARKKFAIKINLVKKSTYDKSNSDYSSTFS